MPERSEPRAVVHGKVDRPKYTVERVYLESYPGHYVTGNLYRPKGTNGPVPAVLSPYGHWGGGRFQDLGVEGVQREIELGAERFERGGRHPLQARCAQLARMGCLVFQYDLEGYADSQQVPNAVAHAAKAPRPHLNGKTGWGFHSTQAELRLLSVLGLQTFNSLCALDWVASLPEVDRSRLAITGGSGGATQTLMLCALDDRISAAFAAVMVSTAMQGGCPCENACCLRVGANNVDFAGLFAPKPMGMASANDWTKDFLTEGYPELQRVYGFYDAPQNVALASLTQFKHNYNYESRSHMYRWFDEHLNLNAEDRVVEQDFDPLTMEELRVWTDDHPAPPGGESHEVKLLQDMSTIANKPLQELKPHDTASWQEFRRVYQTAWRVLLAAENPAKSDLSFEETQELSHVDWQERRGLVRDQARGTELPVIILMPNQWNEQYVLWVHGQGKQALFAEAGSIRREIAQLLEVGYAVVGADLLYQGEFLNVRGDRPNEQIVNSDRDLAPYTFGYNPSLFAHRTSDLITLATLLANWKQGEHRVHAFGVAGAGPWVAAARAIAGPTIGTALVNSEGFRFENVQSWRDPSFVPGAVKYGDLPVLLALSAPHRLCIAGEQGEPPQSITDAYSAAGARNELSFLPLETSASAASLVTWFLSSRDDKPR